VTVCINTLYFFNLMPPIPLSLKDGGIYHSLQVNYPGNYTVAYEDQGPLAFLRGTDNIHIKAGSSLYAESAIFSPTSFNTQIIHEWQSYDTTTGKWVTRSQITLAIVGGRDGGYRTYSILENLAPGAWRVNVKTPSGQIIGRMEFNVTIVDAVPRLSTKLIGG
jgi:hypothetical protein